MLLTPHLSIVKYVHKLNIACMTLFEILSIHVNDVKPIVFDNRKSISTRLSSEIGSPPEIINLSEAATCSDHVNL